MDPIFEQEIIGELPVGDTSVESVETPAAAATTTSFNDRRKSWTPAETAQWKLTGEEPVRQAKTDTDGNEESSTSSAEINADSEPAAEQTSAEQQRQSDKPGFSKKQTQKRFEELIEERGSLKRQLEDMQRQLAEKTAPNKQAEAARPAQAAVARPKRPNLNDPKFKTLDDYETAMDTYETEKEAYDQAKFDSRINETVSTVEQTRTQKQIESDRTQATARMEKIHSDYKAVAFNPKVPASGAMIHLLNTLPNGPELRYALGKNIAEATRIAKLTEIEDLAELTKTNPQRAAYLWGKAENTAEVELAKLAKPKAAPLVKKEPAKPTSEVAVNGRGNVETMDDTALMKTGKISHAEWKRRENQKDAEAWKAGTR